MKKSLLCSIVLLLAIGCASKFKPLSNAPDLTVIEFGNGEQAFIHSSLHPL